jgi:hypothetical protein
MGINSFTINQHYIFHICSVIQLISPFQSISARPLERMESAIQWFISFGRDNFSIFGFHRDKTNNCFGIEELLY